jgi:multiple sugar transport system ATP-binding protein
VAQLVLENIYKSFPGQKGEKLAPVTSETLIKTPDTAPAFSKVSQRRGGVNVLRQVNLTVADGEFLVLVGPSGCGKSTLLRIIAGLEEVTGGNIWIEERVINELPPKERDIAMVFQNYALYPHLNVYDNIAFGLRRTQPVKPIVAENWQQAIEQRLRRWGKDTAVGLTRKLPPGLRYRTEKEERVDTQVRRVAKLLQIEPLLNRLPKQLSGGQKQRVALGRAIARNPQVFLMDEPLSNLDAKLRTETRSQIVQLQKQLGITTIYVTHDQTEAMTMGDRIAVMNQGEIQQLAPPIEIYNRPANRFVAEFIGSPPMNFLTVQVKAPTLIAHDLFRLTLPEKCASILQVYEGGSILLGVRPEHLKPSPPATKNIPVTVDVVEALGNETLLKVHLNHSQGTSLQVRVAPDYAVQVQDSLWLSLTLEKIHLFDPKTQQAVWHMEDHLD